jgi:YHS domain-containing protein
MYARMFSRLWARSGRVFLVFIALATSAAGQSPADADQQHEGHTTSSNDQQQTPAARDGSGTAWLPDESPMYVVHSIKGPWMLMFHENAFLQYLKESGDRGDDQFGSINWIMGMAERSAGPGRLGLRGMFSAEPWSIRGCGYPDLLATGEECSGEQIHDRQHPHDLFMELAAIYDAPLEGKARWQVYGGPAGEPALGPVAYPHRLSAMPNPLAPISHHWLDSTHITFGVVTGAVYGGKWKAEASVFNGREPDEQRTNIDFAALDSVSGRLWFLPSPRVALQVSAGHLKEAEPGDAGSARIDVNRITASATYHRVFEENSLWATTVAWGRNAESGHGASNAFLAESTVTFRQRDTLFGRFEVAAKSAHDLVVPEPPESFTVAKLQAGYTRYLRPWSGFQPGVGGGLSLGIVPGTLAATYGRRVNPGVAIFLTVRPAAMAAGAHAAHGAESASTADGMVVVQTAFDPSKLSCPASVDKNTAASTIYEGKTYYFCSAADRDRFLTDPKMSLSMMPPKQ